MQSTQFGSPIGYEDRMAFLENVAADPNFGTQGVTVKEQDLHWEVDFTTADDVGTDKSPLPVNPLNEAAKASNSGSICRRTQVPLIDGAGKLPGALRICLFGFWVQLKLNKAAESAVAIVAEGGGATAGIAAAALDEIMGIPDTFVDSVTQMGNGTQIRMELDGETYVNLGPSRALQALYLAATGEATLPTPYFGGVMQAAPKSFAQIRPFEIGTDQQFDLTTYLPRTTAWPYNFSARWAFRALVASKS